MKVSSDDSDPLLDDVLLFKSSSFSLLCASFYSNSAISSSNLSPSKELPAFSEAHFIFRALRTSFCFICSVTDIFKPGRGKSNLVGIGVCETVAKGTGKSFSVCQNQALFFVESLGSCSESLVMQWIHRWLEIQLHPRC